MKQKKRKYKVLTQSEVREAYAFQTKETIWNFYDERAFIEKLFSNRFNFLLVVYSLFITAFASIDGKSSKIIILSLGLLVTIAISLTVYRAYVKLIINLKILYDLGEKHVLSIIGKETKAQGKFALWNVNPLFGIYVPVFFILSFIVALILISCNYWVFTSC